MKYLLFLSMGIVFILTSCTNLGFISGKSWSSDENRFVSLELGTVQIDKKTDWDSVEAETRRLLPFLFFEFWTKQEIPVPEPAFRVDVILIEREYLENWKTRRSLSAEILVWNAGITENLTGEKIPLAAGKALLSGNKSLSSSKVLHSLLKHALSNALKALPKK
ncbi:MAG: hypothetical protein LBH07_00570 [Treponema sp.]|jgi:hypothetical protein|nr:hypothetical protein [Treponema sp.]